MSVAKNNKVLSEQLIAHFDLNEDPFEESLSVFFEGAQRQHNLETLRHMSTFGDMVLLLTGERGAGKTTLIARFLETCSEELNIYATDIKEMESKEKAQSVIQQLASSVGLSIVQGETTRQVFSRLLQFLEEQFQRDGLRNVLVFDNADALPKKELQFYFSYFSQLPKESGVVAVFAGSPSLLQVARLSNIDGAEEWLHQLQLKPLGASDMLEYLQLRLEASGYKGLLELNESQVQHLIDIGKGLPGRVNRLFSSVVLEPGALKLQSKHKPKIPKPLVFGVPLLLVFSFLVVAYQYGLFGGSNDSIPESVLVAELTNNDEAEFRSSDEARSKDAQRLEVQRAERLKMLDKALSESLIKEDAKSVSEIVKIIEPPKSEENSQEIEKEEKVDEEKVVARDVEKDVEKAKKDKVGDSDKKSLAEAKTDKTLSNGPKLAKAEASSIQNATASHSLFKTRAWLESQSQTAYSAQILGSYNEQTAIQFAQRVSNEASSIYYLKTLHRGRPWFVVFYGVFPDKAAAKEAITEAPKLIQSQKPWLRRVDGILGSYPK